MKLVAPSIRPLWVGAVLGILSCTPAPGQTLKEALCLMLEFEPELNAAEYDTLSSRETQKITRSTRLPHLSADFSSGVSERDRSTDAVFRSGDTLFQRQAGLSIRQLLYDGGVSLNDTKASRNAFLAQHYLEKSMIESRFVDLCEVYLEILRTQKQIQLAEKNVENHTRMRDMLEQQVEAGGGRAGLALVEGRLGLARNTVATARLNHSLAESRFQRLTGRMPSGLVYPDIPSVSGSLDSIDLDNNHDYLAAVEALEAAKHRAEATRGYHGPKVFFDAGVSAGEDAGGIRGSDNEASALVIASWDLFSGGYNKGIEKREHFQVGKYEELLRAADVQRNHDLDLLWQERQGALASINALEKYATELDTVASDYKEQFEVGRQELINILDIQSEAYTAESSLVDSRFDYHTSAFRILGVQGQAVRTVLGKESYAEYFPESKSPVCSEISLETFDKADPDCRVPLTQEPLMQGKFDTDGPVSDYGSPHQTYYEERSQFPIEPSVDCKPKGKFFGLFSRRSSAPVAGPIFK